MIARQLPPPEVAINSARHQNLTHICLLARELVDMACISRYSEVVILVAAAVLVTDDVANSSRKRLEGWTGSARNPEQALMRLRVVITALVDIGADKCVPGRFNELINSLCAHVNGRHECVIKRPAEGYASMTIPEELRMQMELGHWNRLGAA